MTVLLYGGAATFYRALQLPVAGDPTRIVAADANGYGDPDLLVIVPGANALQVSPAEP